MKNLIAILVSFIILNSACEKKKIEEKDEIEEVKKTEMCEAKKISGVLHGDYFHFELKLKNKLYDTIYISEFSDFAVFSYDVDQNLTKVEYIYDNKLSEYEVYSYVGGKANKINYYKFNSVTNEFEHSKYKKVYFKGELIVKVEDFKLTNELSYFEEFTYDGNGNVINSNSFNIFNNDTFPRYRLVFTYDDKNASPLSSLMFFDYLLTKNKNNVTSRKYESFNRYDMTWNYSEFNTYNYEYNNKGYPVKMTSNENETLEFEYFDCQ